MTDATNDQLHALIAPQIAAMGYELWGIVARLGAGRGKLCVYIDHADGIGLADCAAVSEQISGLLDVEDCIASAYQLEVSSPGIDRLLLCPAHFVRYAKQAVQVRLRYPTAGRRKFDGIIDAADDEDVTFLVEHESLSVPYRAIAQVRLQYTEEDLIRE